MDFFVADPRLAESKVFSDGTGKQKNVLHHNTDQSPERMFGYGRYVDPIDTNTPPGNGIEFRKNIDNRCFTASGRTDNSDFFATLYPERHIPDHPVFRVIGKPHVVKNDIMFQ